MKRWRGKADPPTKKQIHWSRQRTKKAKKKKKKKVGKGEETVFKTGLPSPCRQVWHTRIWTAGLMWARYGNHADTFWKLDSCADIFKYLNNYCKLCHACIIVNYAVFVYLYIISYYTFLKHIKDKKVQKNAIYDLERMLFMIWILF